MVELGQMNSDLQAEGSEVEEVTFLILSENLSQPESEADPLKQPS